MRELYITFFLIILVSSIQSCGKRHQLAHAKYHEQFRVAMRHSQNDDALRMQNLRTKNITHNGKHNPTVENVQLNTHTDEKGPNKRNNPNPAIIADTHAPITNHRTNNTKKKYIYSTEDLSQQEREESFQKYWATSPDNPANQEKINFHTISFKEAFVAARKQGLQKFTWKGKNYGTRLQNEINYGYQDDQANQLQDGGPYPTIIYQARNDQLSGAGVNPETGRVAGLEEADVFPYNSDTMASGIIPDQVIGQLDQSGMLIGGEGGSTFRLEDEAVLNIVIFPNLTYTYINVQLSNLTENTNYQLLNMQGQVLQTGTIISNSVILNMENFSVGIYMLNIDHYNFKVINQ